MNQSVDLTDLRSMTDGDADMETALFEEFFRATEEGLLTMQEQCGDGLNEAWRTTAHALKGISYNVGAMPLGNLYKHAQEHADAAGAEKQSLLEKIRAEYTDVEAFLRSLHS